MSSIISTVPRALSVAGVENVLVMVLHCPEEVGLRDGLLVIASRGGDVDDESNSML